MIAFYFFLLGAYLYYSRSRYFPAQLFKISVSAASWSGAVCMLFGAGIYIYSDGWAGGLLLALAACSLAMMMIRFFAVLGKSYFYGMLTFVHCLVLIRLVTYAS